jgi:hypothetical protein
VDGPTKKEYIQEKNIYIYNNNNIKRKKEEKYRRRRRATGETR